ncbi:ATPase family protein [Spathaspora sp. JA1]|nr:ATPase family protein [Spathaspora sp. JA1]
MSTKKKKTPSGSTASGSTPTGSTPVPDAPKKIKLPKSYIVRPHSSPTNKTISQIILNPEVITALSFTIGEFIHVSRDGTPGIIGIVQSGDVDRNIVEISSEYRQLAGFLLGDRIDIGSYTQQPGYAKCVYVNKDTLDKKILDDVGLIYPGLKLNDGTIIDIESSLETSLDKLSLESNNGSDLVSPPYIFVKSTAKLETSAELTPSTSKYPYLPNPITFASVGGLAKQINLLQQTISLPLHSPNLFSDFGISPPRGILLHGPPGTGKTMLLRCAANTSNAHVLTINGPSIVSKYLGETENTIRDIFAEARKYQPSIIFMDEIDALVPSRTGSDAGETESRVVAQLLTMMDGMDNGGRVVIVGATNRPNSIDIALRRPGRFDTEVEIGIPDIDSRVDILDKLFTRMNKEKYLVTKSEIELVASKTHGYVGADLSALVRESVMLAIKQGLTSNIPHHEIKVTVDHLLEAYPDIRPSAMREILLEMPKVYWSDIGGQQELKRKLIEVVQLPLQAAKSFTKLGISAPKGVLLYGPPGCSKTLTAKALATESGLNFLAVKGPEIFNKYVGESERTIREIFRKARAASPSIIFFDEIDAIASTRDGGSTTDASSNVLVSLLNEIDGVEELKGVVIIGATNKPNDIDPALLRPGRLDRHIYVSPPDFEARVQILQKCCRKFELLDDVDLNELAKLTQGCSGAEVTLLCQEAGLAAIMEDNQCSTVHKRHFDHALAGISRGITQEMLQYYQEFANRSGLTI